MLELYLNGTKYEFPNQWEELTQEQFIYLSDLLWKYQQGLISAGEVRIQYFLHVAGLKPRRIRRAEREQLFSENVYRACTHINFFFKWKYQNEKAFAGFPAELQKELLRTDPDDMETTQDVRVARKMKRHMEIDAAFARNLVPSLPGNRRINAYRFVLEENFLDTSMTAAQYVDAYSVFETWSRDGKPEAMDLLVATLYQDKNYSSEMAHRNKDLVKRYPEDIKRAIVLNYMAIHVFLSQRTKYAILFSGTGSDKSGKITLGFHDSIYSLIKAGYGDVEQMNLVKFLELMLKELIDNVNTLKANDMKLEDIASKLKMTVSQVKLLT
ncbi:MAG: hypothetical protein V2B15_08605 [Bacteroidota bacterium]